MSEYKYPNKDRPVKLYYQKSVNWRNGTSNGIYLEKHYVHPKKEHIWAYLRQIVAETKISDPALIPADRFLIVINWRNLPKGQYYFEHKGRTFKVLNRDDYESRDVEIKFECQEIDADETAYRRVSDEGWRYQ